MIRSSLEDFATPLTPAPIVVVGRPVPRRAFVFVVVGHDGLHVDPVKSVGARPPIVSSTRSDVIVSQTPAHLFVSQTKEAL
jgi:hypothetical protein